MLKMTLTLKQESYSSTLTTNLERIVANFILEWHFEDNLQEVLNMALAANHIPASLVKIGGPPDTLAFLVQPYPSGRR